MKREREPVPNAQVARSHRESADVSLIDSTVLGGRVGRERGKEGSFADRLAVARSEQRCGDLTDFDKLILWRSGRV